ncbi:adenylyl-sulfate kinase [Rubrivirga sp.]|uniref:adenylyl-sulfate kinase n=1 Tax=Rubrivirga sp. TaxID=1885344 RepID=UPI003C783EDD
MVWEGLNIPRETREEAQGHGAAVVWFTGLSGSGKTTIARALERQLFHDGVRTMLLDGDYVRHGLNGDLGFSPEDRRENVRRVGEVARLFFEAGSVVLCTFVSPYRADRDRVRSLIPEGRFVEVFVDVDLEVARARDPKGLYARSQAGDLEGLTGVDAPYQAPVAPEVTVETRDVTVEESVESLRRALVEAGVVPGGSR